MLCVACPPLFFVPPAPVVGGGAGVMVVCDIESLVSSDWKPGIRILWLRSRWSWRSRTSSVSPPRCLARRQEKFVTESINSSAMSSNNLEDTALSYVDYWKKTGAHIFYIWFDLYTRIDARHQILNGPPHALIPRRIFPSRCATII